MHKSLPHTTFGILIMVVEMIQANVYWINSFPAEYGVSKTMGSIQIFTGHIPYYKIHCGLQFGSYFQVHNNGDNAISARTTGTLTLRPMGNTPGVIVFSASIPAAV